jgi:hypothetical protein
MAEDLGFDSQQGQETFLSSTMSRPLWGPTSLFYNGHQGLIFPVVKWERHEADHSLPYIAKVKNDGA